MATYYVKSGDRYTYTPGEQYWRDSDGNLKTDLQPDGLPIPPLYTEEGMKSSTGHFLCKVVNKLDDLTIEVKLRSVPELISKCSRLFPGVVISQSDELRIAADLNIDVEDASSLTEIIAYAMNDGFEMVGGTYTIDDMEFDTIPIHIDWKIQ